MIKRLKVKFICINMAIVTAMLLVIFGMVLHFTQRAWELQCEQMMNEVLDNAAGTHKMTLPGLRPGARPQEVQMPYFYVAVNVRGEVTVAKSGYFDVSDGEDLQTILRLALESKESSGQLPQYSLRFLKHATPWGQALVFVDISGEMATRQSLVRTFCFVGLLWLSVFFGISVLLARWTVRPVENAWNQQRQFVADASHELKTPLTVIMTNAELLQSPAYGEAERGKFASSILTMSHQMRGLVESLLELARVDNGTAKMEFSRLDFGALISDALLPFEPVYFERGLTLESDISEGVFVNGSGSHLRQVVEILLDNGAKYSSAQEVDAGAGANVGPLTVTVRLQRQGSHCLLSVSSPGDTISREDLKNIFKRFYRMDKARSMNHSYGLGLSIAESIVKEHGGKIWAESGGGVNTFFVQLAIV